MLEAYRVRLIFEDGSVGYLMNHGGDLFTSDDVMELMPTISGIKEGSIQIGHDKDHACQTSLDVWERILGYKREDFILITDVELEPIDEKVELVK